MIFQGLEYLNYLLRSIHLHGIHSPFVFKLQQDVIKDKSTYYAFEQIESIRAKLLLSEQEINVIDFGAGSHYNKNKKRSISSIAKTALKPKKYGELLFKLCLLNRSEYILELGTCLGISTAYLASANSSSQVTSIEGDPQLCKISKLNLEKLQLNNIKVIEGNFDEHLPDIIEKTDRLDFVFFDGNHRYASTLSYFNQCVEKASENSIFVFDDIYWSKGMKKAWREIISHPKVTVSIDLFQIGILFFKTDQKKQNFTIYH